LFVCLVDRLNEEVYELRFYLKGGDREETKVRIRGKPRAKAKQRFKRGGQKGFEEDLTSPVSS